MADFGVVFDLDRVLRIIVGEPGFFQGKSHDIVIKADSSVSSSSAQDQGSSRQIAAEPTRSHVHDRIGQSISQPHTTRIISADQRFRCRSLLNDWISRHGEHAASMEMP